MEPRVFIHHPPPASAGRAGRTRRSLQLAGIPDAEDLGDQAGDWRAMLAAGQPVLLCRAGAWLVHPAAFGFPRPSATGKGLCALGALRTAPGGSTAAAVAHAAEWDEWLAATGGDFARLPDAGRPLAESQCPPPLIYLDGRAVRRSQEAGVASIDAVLRLAASEFRLVHFAPLDAHYDDGLRVFQVITALHRGGAERMTLDLLATLPQYGVRTRLATLGKALRTAFPSPAGTVALGDTVVPGPEARSALLARAAKRFGADLLHGHLIPGDEVRRLAATGLPMMLTVHNTRAGWPPGLADLRARDTVLLAACSLAVESELRTAEVACPVRCVWNGIDFRSYAASPERVAGGREWRRLWGFSEQDLVLVAVANPRPQKRLHLLPAVLAALRRLLTPAREARLVLVGEAIPGLAETEACAALLQNEIARLDLAPHVRSVGSVEHIADLLAATDLLVSTSAHEGLSLAQLEALAAGRPVVATAVGGAPELAAGHPGVWLLSPDSLPEEFARVIVEAINAGTLPHPVPASANWSRETMAARYHWLYERAVAAAGRTKSNRGLWLITNNFSTGGAQSSARRLLAGLAAQGVRVRAAVVEENPAKPTPGRRALAELGIPVRAVPFPDVLPVNSGATSQSGPDPTPNIRLERASPPLPAESPTVWRCRQLLDMIDADPPEAVVFWNLRPAFKVWLADALLDLPVFDVSPGEMYFESLATFFARPYPGLPYRTARDYGARLAGIIVKYQAEAKRAEKVLGAPVLIIPNGVPLPPEASTTRVSRPELAFGTAARINPRKRLEDLLAAFRLALDRMPPSILRIGGGIETGCEEYAAQLRESARDLPVQWLGEVTDIATLHHDLDVFVMISEPAGCPNASLEAMAAGLPVIATDCGGADEQVHPGTTGLLVPPRDTGALAAALIELANSPALRESLGSAARVHVGHHFAVARMVADYRRICGLTAEPAIDGSATQCVDSGDRMRSSANPASRGTEASLRLSP